MSKCPPGTIALVGGQIASGLRAAAAFDDELGPLEPSCALLGMAETAGVLAEPEADSEPVRSALFAPKIAADTMSRAPIAAAPTMIVREPPPLGF